MAITIEATYEDGVLKPTQPLPLKEHEKVQVTVQSVIPQSPEPPDETEAILRSYGIIGWKGDHDTLERILAETEELL